MIISETGQLGDNRRILPHKFSFLLKFYFSFLLEFYFSFLQKFLHFFGKSKFAFTARIKDRKALFVYNKLSNHRFISLLINYSFS